MILSDIDRQIKVLLRLLFQLLILISYFLYGSLRLMQRYVLCRPYTGLDMCGVIKSPPAGAITSTQLCGVAKLNAHGCCVVLLPPEFPDPDTAQAKNSSGSSGVYPYAPFTVAYHLTPLGSAMPQLHISTEVTRFSTSVWRSMGSTVAAAKGGKGTEGETTTSKNSAASKASGSTIAPKKKSVAVQLATDISEQARVDMEHELEQNILRNYWASNKKSTNMTLARDAAGKIPRSVSTGNIPAFYSSPLRNAMSTGSFQNLHNDRLIDGPLPLLRRLGSLSTAAICQLGRDESDSDTENEDSDCHSDQDNGKAKKSPSGREGRAFSDSIPHATQNGSAEHYSVKNGGIIPLCFTISGGLPLGRISWMVTSQPKEANANREETADAYAGSEGAFGGLSTAIRGSKDWRAL